MQVERQKTDPLMTEKVECNLHVVKSVKSGRSRLTRLRSNTPHTHSNYVINYASNSHNNLIYGLCNKPLAKKNRKKPQKPHVF